MTDGRFLRKKERDCKIQVFPPKKLNVNPSGFLCGGKPVPESPNTRKYMYICIWYIV